MGSSVSPTSQLVQTIFNLQDLRLRQQAADLAQKQFGLQTQVAQANIGQTHEQQVAQLGQILQNIQNPQALLDHVDELSQQTGYSTGLLKTLIENTKPNLQTTQAGVVAQGVAQNPGISTPAAFEALTNHQPGQLAADAVQQELMQHAQGYFNSLRPGEQQSFNQMALQHAVNGKTPGEAAVDLSLAALPKDRLRLAAEVGAGIAPTASQDAQVRLGYANLRMEERKITAESADRQAAIMAGLEKAQKDGNLEVISKINQVMHDLNQFTMDAQKNSSTFTPDGKVLYDAQINGMLETLRQLAPNIYGPKGSNPLPNFPKDATVGAPTLGGAIWPFIRP